MQRSKTGWFSGRTKMPSSLFTKIFLWFCIYILTVFAAGFYISLTSLDYSSCSKIVNKINTEALLLYGETLVEKYEEEGPGALARSVNRLESSGDLNVFFFDDRGKEALGRLPAELSKAQVQSIFKEKTNNSAAGFKQISHKIYMVRDIAGKSGKTYIVIAEPKHNFLGNFLVKFLLSRLIIFLIIAGGFSYLLSRYLTNPIRALQAATQKLAMGNLSARIGLQKGKRMDEIGDLTRDFDVMAEKIEILEDVRRQFLSDISHEFRSPLSRLNIAVGMARKKNHNNIAYCLDRIEQESERLTNIIDRILATTQKRNFVATDKPETIHLNHLLTEILKDAEFQAQSRRCTVAIKTDTEVWFTGIRHLIKTALENVIYNAIQYTRAGTSVEICLKSKNRSGGRSCAIVVRDHGTGVPENALRKIFEPFYRTDDSRDRRSGGTGLGLAITERAVQYHHGTVMAANSPGGGLMVEITLPLERSCGCLDAT